MEPHYDDGRVAIHHGDSLAVMMGLADASVDAVITDPPYSSGGQFRGDRAQSTGTKYVSSGVADRGTDFDGDTRDQRSYGYWTALWTGEALRVARKGAPLLVFTDWRQLPTTTDAIQAGGWVWRGVVTWDKVNGRPRTGGFSAATEFIVWATNGPVDDSREVYLPGIIRCAPPRQRDHQTQKPEALMRRLMDLVPPDGTVLDPFAGSGTTGVAAAAEGRRAVLIERSPHYAAVIARRLQQPAEPVLDFGGAA